MPRRDALNEKKRERLMQEHDQLQKLMLQARSSVRRSSLKSEAEKAPEISEETGAATSENSEVHGNMTVEREEEKTTESELDRKEPLNEKDIFPQLENTSESKTKKPPLTEKDLFPNNTMDQEGAHQSQTHSVVKVIWPDQNVAATVARRNIAPEAKEVTYSKVVPENTATSYEHEEPVTEENNTAYTDEPFEEKQPRRKTTLYVLLTIVALGASFGGYYLYQINQKKDEAVAKQSTGTHATASAPERAPATMPDKERMPNSAADGDVNAEQVNTGAKQKSATLIEKEKGATQTPSNADELSEMLKKFDNVTIVKTSADQSKQADADNKNKAPETTAGANLGKYKVISKAYFHDAPDESTRRKSFIIHWNNAVLTPLEEKNGFVYIIFTNHLGQTSKGWLRKEDLQRIE